jgi:hypothetical protein
VKLSATELARLLGVLEKIDRGLIHPQMPDRIGRFLRQYGRGRAELDQVLSGQRVERRADAGVSGRALGTIEVHPILEPEVSVLGFPLSEVAETVAVSEQLGGLANFVMWLKGPIANAAYNLLRANPGLRLTGDYRWNPPARLTPGEAHLEPSQSVIKWQHARCLKAVADDLNRPPHALEYVLDYRMGPPGLKYFRSVCAMKLAQQWHVFAALTQPSPLDIAAVLPEARLNAQELSALLIYCEPWSRGWTIVDAVSIRANDALAHTITWADFRRELDDSELDAAIIAAIRHSFDATGLAPSDFGEPNLTRSLLPVARDILRWLRGSV